ncbi:hypothetical protein BDZ94DRAFT_1280580 [Collybia nuda]|uniref:Prolyl 4-hydroxylase alpha subunit Fe(2+) 2OG dioxygenase domain-containing protein n=1 Tax=Collybia nuda TaxID=64659 RepID=A0A9P6CNQ5_9AGAR|nr:hypothetical protein BDZ94DRAFT_1280580 [Collybia nuda]
MFTTSVQALKASITQNQPFCSGTIPLSSKNAVIFYKEDVKSNWIDLSHPTENALQSLAGACQPATFGVNQRDVLDEAYRKAGKMDNTDFATTFDLNQARLLDMISAQLLSESKENESITAELYKLNVYGKDSFFKAHKDTPRGKAMFGSLVVVYPTQHEGGALILRHGGKEWTFDSADAVRKHDGPAIAYVAFFSDVEHEVAVVTSGYRVTLTYNLYFVDDNAPSTLRPDIMTGFEAAFTTALNDPAFLPSGGLLGFGLAFQYPFSPGKSNLGNLLSRLKGSDAVIKQVCNRLSLHEEYTDGHIMVNQIPDLARIGEIEEPISSILLHGYGGRMVHDIGDGIPGGQGEEQAPNALKILWITPLTGVMQFQSSYLAYGNEASLECIYGDVCLVAQVGPVGQRATKAN